MLVYFLVTILTIVPGSEFSTRTISYPVGAKLCFEKCQSFGKCRYVVYSIARLKCNMKMVHGTALSKGMLCHPECPIFSVCIKTRGQRHVCVFLGTIRVLKYTRSATLSIRTVKKYRVVKKAKSNKKPRWGFATTTWTDPVSGELSAVVKVDFKAKRSSEKLTIHGRLVSLVIYGEQVYWCQRRPDGLYRIHMRKGEIINTTKITIVHNKNCTNLAGDTRNGALFYMTDKRVWRQIPKRQQLTWSNMFSREYSSLLLALDREYGLMYICGSGSNKVVILYYNGTKRDAIVTREPIRHIFVTGRKLYHTTTLQRNSIMTGSIRPKTSRRPKDTYHFIRNERVGNIDVIAPAPFGFMFINGRTVIMCGKYSYRILASMDVGPVLGNRNITGIYTIYHK